MSGFIEKVVGDIAEEWIDKERQRLVNVIARAEAGVGGAPA